MKLPSMKESLAYIDRQVEYLCQNGGKKKLEEWFLSGDRNFNAITAERYVINYLRQKNHNVVDNLSTTGIDAVLKNGSSDVGIEVTTLNGFVAEWIFTQRLTQFLAGSGFLGDKCLDITYSHKKISDEPLTRLYNYVEQAGTAIVSEDNQLLSELDLSVEVSTRTTHCISWHPDDSGDDFPWFRYITDDLHWKLRARNKSQQLERFPRNLVFIGLNHLSPVNWAFPGIFEDLGRDGGRYDSEIQAIGDYWASHLSTLTNVAGICYFFYSLDRETPFYPLKVFGRADSDGVSINL
jgi:hypothetical protein